MAGPSPSGGGLDAFRKVVAGVIIAVWLALHVYVAVDHGFEVGPVFDVIVGGVVASIYPGFAEFVKALWGKNGS